MKKSILIVLGTPYSGISILTQCLHMLGMTSIDDQTQPNILNIHNLLFQSLNHSPTMAGRLPLGWMQTPDVELAKQRIKKFLTSSRSNCEISFLGDPFLGRFMPLWTEALNEVGFVSKFVIIVRHPWEVAQSFVAKENIALDKSHLLWLTYFRDIFHGCQRQRSALITFDQLLADPISILVRIGKELDLLWANDPWSVYSSFLDYVQPSRKNYHVSNQPKEDGRKYHAYEKVYHEYLQSQQKEISDSNVDDRHPLLKPDNTLPGTEGIIQVKSPETFQTDLVESLLSIIGQYERKLTNHQAEKDRITTEVGSSLYTQIIFPSIHGEGKIIETITLIIDEWQKISIPVPEPSLLQNKHIILKPLNTNGVVQISTLSLINFSTGNSVWSAKTAKNFYRLAIEGSAIKIPDNDKLSLLVTGFDSHLVLPCLKDSSDYPMQFEVWLKPSKKQKVLHDNVSFVQNSQNRNRLKAFAFNFPRIICAHHKAGTNFILKTFRKIAKEFNIKLWMKFYEPNVDYGDWGICIHQHSRVNDILSKQNFRGWHCVRHPKALIYSATLYHQKCEEEWAKVPLDEFSSHTFWAATDGILYNKINDPNVSPEEKKSIMNNKYWEKTSIGFKHFPSSYDIQGKTYKEFLLSLPTLKEKILFEMRSYSKGVINDMLSFPNDNRFFMIQLESISFDHTMNSLRSAFSHIGFKGNDLMKCLEIASENCLWNLDKKTIAGHSTSGMSDDWKDIFTGDVEKEYRRIFGWAEEAMGYNENA